MIMQNKSSGWDIENIGTMLGLLRCDLYHSALFLFCVLKHYLAGELIFHFPSALATWEAKYFRRCFNGTFDNLFWHLHQQNQPVFCSWTNTITNQNWLRLLPSFKEADGLNVPFAQIRLFPSALATRETKYFRRCLNDNFDN